MKNWKTTFFGILLAAGQALENSDKPVVAIIGQALTIDGALGVGAAARDKTGLNK